MYEELLPFWKRRCKALRQRDPGQIWTGELNRRGFWHKSQVDSPEDTLGYEWIATGREGYDCLVAGIMLFTWEAGIAP